MDPISTTIFAGKAHPALARDIAFHLGLSLGRISVGRFSDGEISVEIMENVRGRDVFIVQPTCPPVNENLMELLIMADACQRASAARVTAVTRAADARWQASAMIKSSIKFSFTGGDVG